MLACCSARALMVLVISANQEHLVFSSVVPGGGRLMCGMGGGVESGMMIGASLWRHGMSRNSCPVPDSMLAMCFWNSSSFVVSSAFWAISVRRRLASATHGCGGVTVTGKGAGVISVVPCATLVGGSVAFDTLDGPAIGKGVDLLMELGVKIGVPQTLVLVLRSRSLGTLGRFLVVE